MLELPIVKIPDHATQEEIILYDQLRQSLEKQGINDPSVITTLSERLANYWQSIKGKENSYFQHFDHWFNQICLAIAHKINPEHPYQLLMPDLTGKCDTYGNCFDTLKPNSFITVENDNFFIVFSDFFDAYWQRVTQGERRTLEYINENNEVMTLSERDKKALQEMVPAAEVLFNKVDVMNANPDKTTMLDKLQALRAGLLAGDVNHQGEELEAAPVANMAIVDFYTFFKALDKKKKNQLRRLRVGNNKPLGYWLDLLFKPLKEAGSLSSRYCLATIGREIEAIINHHAAFLREFDVDENYSQARKSYHFVLQCLEQPIIGAVFRDDLKRFNYYTQTYYTQTTWPDLGKPLNDKQGTLLHVAARYNSVKIMALLFERTSIDVNALCENQTPLFIAAQNGHVKAVELLLAQGANKEMRCSKGKTALFIAAQNGHLEVVKLLLQHGAVVDSPCFKAQTALLAAVKNGYYDIAELLILKGASVKQVRSGDGFTALHLAVQRNFFNLANLLISHGALTDAKGLKEGVMPIHLAARAGHYELILQLIMLGASINSKTSSGATALHCASKNGHVNIVDYLLDEGAIQDLTNDGTTPLHYAVENGHIAIAHLLRAGASINQKRTLDGVTALHLAAKTSNFEMTGFLLAAGAKQLPSRDGSMPIHFAAERSNLPIVRLLHTLGASVKDERSVDGMSPIHFAAKNGHVGLMKFLISKGASIHQTCNRGCTPLHYAAEFGYSEAIRFLVSQGAKVNTSNSEGIRPLYYSASGGHCNAVETLLECGASIEAYHEYDGSTALHAAVKNNHVGVIGLLLNKAALTDAGEKGALIDTGDREGETPLHYAAEYGYLKVARLLIEENATVNRGSKSKVSPLYLAVHYGHKDVAELLLSNGAEVNKQCVTGKTPLMAAIMEKNKNLVRLLLEHNADIEKLTFENQDAYEIAKDGGDVEIIKLIKEKILTNFIAVLKKQDPKSKKTTLGFFGYALMQLPYTTEKYLAASKAYRRVLRGKAESESLNPHREVLRTGKLATLYP